MTVTVQDLFTDAIALKDIFVETVVNAVPKEKRGTMCGSYLTSRIDFKATNNPFISHYEEVEKFLNDAASFIERELTPLSDEQIAEISEKLELPEEAKKALNNAELNSKPVAKSMIIAFEAARMRPEDPDLRKISRVARRFFIPFTAAYLAALAEKKSWIEQTFPKMFDKQQRFESLLLESIKE